MSKQDSQSIQQLLISEKKAEEKVNQARKRKHLRLKQAKEDALKEIDEIRQERNKEFKEYESKFQGNKESIEMKIECQTGKALSDLEKFVKLNKNIVITYLMEQAFNVKCEVHPNFRSEIF